MAYLVIYYPRKGSRKPKIVQKRTRKAALSFAREKANKAPAVYRITKRGPKFIGGFTFSGEWMAAKSQKKR